VLLEIAIGDAYGAGFEFSPLEKIEKYNTLNSYQEHELGIAPGCYTDDTQMSLAIAELMLEGVPWTKRAIADKFVNVFKRDPRLGYSKGFQAFLSRVHSGEEFIRHIKPHSERNGAAMRSAPLGYVRKVDTLLSMAQVQAALTHDTEVGVQSAQAIALAAHYFIYNLGDKKHVHEFVEQHTTLAWQKNWNSPVSCCGKETVNAVLSLLSSAESYREILIGAVAFSGDVDTVAAVGLGIASRSHLYNKALPDFLKAELESGPCGREYLVQIGNKLENYRSAHKTK